MNLPVTVSRLAGRNRGTKGTTRPGAPWFLPFAGSLVAVLCAPHASFAKPKASPSTPACSPAAPTSAADRTFSGDGDLPSKAREEAGLALARSVGWPTTRALPPSVTAIVRTVSTCALPDGKVRLDAAVDSAALRAAFEALVARESEALGSLSFLASHPDAGVALGGQLALRSHLRGDGRTSLGILSGACRRAGGCAVVPETEARAEALAAKAEASFEFSYAPEDETAGNLIGEIDAGLRARGLSLRDTSVTNMARQLKTRCQKVILPRVEGETLRVVELACEAEAIVRGRKVAAMRFVGRGQDVSSDDATIDARRRLALEDFRVTGGLVRE